MTYIPQDPVPLKKLQKLTEYRRIYELKIITILNSPLILSWNYGFFHQNSKI